MGLKTILRKPKKEKAPSSDVKKLKLLITVINKNKTEFYLDFLGGFDCNFQMSVPAKGTAATETLRLLGLEDTDKIWTTNSTPLEGGKVLPLQYR